MLVGLLIGFRRGMKKVTNKSYDTRRVFMESLGGTLIGLVIGFMCSMVLSLAVKSSRVPVEQSNTQIYAMADGSGISGRFFLGSGTIKNTEYYYYYEEQDGGGMKQKKVPVDNTIIFEHTDSSAFLITKTDILPESHWAIGWAVFDGSGSCGCAQNGSAVGPGTTYDFHIPTGSIQHNYNLDLE